MNVASRSGTKPLTRTSGHPEAAEPVVAVRRRLGVGVHPGDDDEPGHGATEHELDPLVLAHPGRELRADDGRVALLHEQRLHPLDEGGEHGVVELGDDEADDVGLDPGAAAARDVAGGLGGGEHPLAHRVAHAVLAAQGTADGGGAHPHLGSDDVEGGHGPEPGTSATSQRKEPWSCVRQEVKTR